MARTSAMLGSSSTTSTVPGAVMPPVSAGPLTTGADPALEFLESHARHVSASAVGRRSWCQDPGDRPTDPVRRVERDGMGTVVLSAPAGGPVVVGGGAVRPGLHGLGGGHGLRERLLPPEHGLQARV